MWRFTTIQHIPRKALGITVLEYCFLDYLYKAQTWPHAKYIGWCSDPYRKIAKNIGVSVGSMTPMVQRMVNMGLMEVDASNTRKKRVLERFYAFVYKDDWTDEEIDSMRLSHVRISNKKRTNIEQKRTNIEQKRTNIERKVSNSNIPSNQNIFSEETSSSKKFHLIKEMATTFDKFRKINFCGDHEVDGLLDTPEYYNAHIWNKGRGFKHLKNVSDKLRKSISQKQEKDINDITDEYVHDAFIIMLNQFIKYGDEWQRLNFFSPAMMDSKFNDIIIKITLNHGKQQSTTTNQYYDSTVGF